MKDRLELSEVVLLGRMLEEYRQYFQLTDQDLKSGSVLDLGAGISSFCAEVTSHGYTVTAADPIYDLPIETIAAKSQADLDNVLKQLPGVLHKYNWSFYKDPADLAAHRAAARRAFLIDYPMHQEHYVTASLPRTRFVDSQFSLVLVSHFLFLYDDLFDYEFHKRSVLEAARIAEHEVRIYPLVNMTARKSIFIDKLIQDTECSGLRFTTVKIDFEFFKNANELLIIRRA